jgi:hypothetical protein
MSHSKRRKSKARLRTPFSNGGSKKCEGRAIFLRSENAARYVCWAGGLADQLHEFRYRNSKDPQIQSRSMHFRILSDDRCYLRGTCLSDKRRLCPMACWCCRRRLVPASLIRLKAREIGQPFRGLQRVPQGRDGIARDLFLFSRNNVMDRHPASSKRDVRVVTIRGVRGAVAAISCARRALTVADGEIVWSWPPGAEACATRKRRRKRGQVSRSPRRSRISRKPIARGMPDVRLNL